jgi:hypothetical protein
MRLSLLTIGLLTTVSVSAMAIAAPGELDVTLS